MPWKGVTVSEQRQRFLEDFQLNYYSVSDLAERFGISRKTAHKWIDRYEEHGQDGYQELSRSPHSCPWQTDAAVVEELVGLRNAHPHWGPRKLLDLLQRRHGQCELPAVSTAARILAREGLVTARRRFRRAHPGCPKTVPQGPNDIWAADYKGQFRLKDGQYGTRSQSAIWHPGTCWAATHTPRSPCSAQSSISSASSRHTGSPIASEPTTEHPSPPTPWPGCPRCRCACPSRRPGVH